MCFYIRIFQDFYFSSSVILHRVQGFKQYCCVSSNLLASVTAEKSQQADLVVTAVEKFAQVIPLDMQEIFIWYFEQKGVDNPERFLAQGVNEGAGANGVNGEQLTAGNPEGSEENINPAHNATQPQQEAQADTITAQSQPETEQQEQQNSVSPDILMQLIGVLIPLLQSKSGKKSSEFGDFIQQIEQLSNTEEEK